jgi:Zinc finger, C2H2 type
MQSPPSSSIPIPARNGRPGDHPSLTSPVPGRDSSGSDNTITSNFNTNEPIIDSGNNSVNRQRRQRSRRDKEKRFTCDHPGCDKTYTRAEHLTRHQLNRKTSLRLFAASTGLMLTACVDSGAYKFVCRVDPRCGKKFVRGDLLNRHEERHQNKKLKQALSDDGHSPPPRIAPSPPRVLSPSGDQHGSITIPMSNSNSPSDVGSEVSDDPGTPPEDMAIDSGPFNQYQSPPIQPSYHHGSYNVNHGYPQQSVSPSNYNGGFVPINQSFPTQNVTSVDDYARNYPSSRMTDPVNIPRSAFSPPLGISPPVPQNTNVFAGNYNGAEMMGDLGMLGQENWNDILLPTGPTGGSYQWEAGTFPEYGDAPQMYPTQSNEIAPFGEGRRSSVYYPPVPSHPR